MSRRKPGHGSRGVTVTGGRLDCAASDVTVTKRDGAVALAGVGGRSRRGDGADHIAPLVLAGAGPMAGSADRHACCPGTPYTDCAMGLLIPVAHNRIIFIEIDFVSGRTPSNIPGRETAPYGWIDRYLSRNL
jgi:hypothetical protein